MQSGIIMSNVSVHTLTICSLVYFMMSFTEYLHTVAYGGWTHYLLKNRLSSYLFCALLGVVPGCVGAFACVTLYTHGLVSLGAIVACMVATCGDEAFILLSLTPKVALWLFALLFGLGVVAGVGTDKIFGTSPKSCQLHLHQHESTTSFSLHISGVKVCFLLVSLLLLGLGLFSLIGGQGTFRLVFIGLSCLHLALLAVSSEHFLTVHIWEHIVVKHLGKIFLWTWGFMMLTHFAAQYVQVASWVSANRWTMLLLACVVGILPESGPNIVFVTLFYTQLLPFPILLANSIVQDGHGMLPLLAESKRDFLTIKAINLALGLLVGAGGLLVW